MDLEPETVRKRLKERRARLIARVEAMSGALASPHDADLGEQAIEREGDEVLELLGQADRHEVAAIDAALARVEAGSYGLCTVCGAAIDPERLAVLPETPFCTGCARDG